VEVTHGEDALQSLGDPLGLRQCLASGAVAIATRVEFIDLVTTIQTHPSMPAEKRCSTCLNGTHDLGLRVGHVTLVSVRRSKLAEDVADL
jgi:hypothetical protein